MNFLDKKSVMGLNLMMSLKLALTVALILSVCVSTGVMSEDIGCSFQGLQLDNCLNQNGEYVFLEPCCRAINLALRTGFHCLCSALAMNTPQFASLFSWSMSSCYISVPPMTMCRDLGTMPIALPVPPMNPSQEVQYAQANQLVPLSPPPVPVDISSISSTSNGTSYTVQTPAELSENVTQILHVSEKGNNASDRNDATSTMCCYTWLLYVAVYSMALLA